MDIVLKGRAPLRDNDPLPYLRARLPLEPLRTSERFPAHAAPATMDASSFYAPLVLTDRCQIAEV